MKRIAKPAALIVLALITLLNICTMLFSSLELRERLNWFPAALLEVESGSMEPRLSVGDLLVVWETPYEKLEAGDIITFHHGTELVTHELCRWDGSRLVTKGMANAMEDASIGPEDYCARMLFAIPMGGAVLEAFTSPASLAISILLLLFLFYGMPLLKKLWGMLEKKPADVKRLSSIRIAASLAAVSVLAVTPFMTAAKYTAQINEYTTAVAAAKYFSSNYISEEGTKYDIRGWNGEHYDISLSLRNYANDLLFNTLGHDLTYCIRLVQVTGEGYQNDYSLTLEAPTSPVPTDGEETDEELPEAGGQTGGNLSGFSISTNWPDGTKTAGYLPGAVTGSGEAATALQDYGPYVLTGSDEGGRSSLFRVKVDVKQAVDPETGEEKYLLEPGEKIRFQIYAGTETDDEYFQQLWGDFTLEVATANSFLGEQRGDTAVGTSLVTYSLKTKQVGGNSTRNIKISWDKSKLYINEYEATIQNLKLAHPEYLVLDDGQGRGYAILPLQAYSSVSLQFFKYDANTPVYFSGYNDDSGHGHVPDIYVIEEGDPIPEPPADVPTEEGTPTEEETPTEEGNPSGGETTPSGGE